MLTNGVTDREHTGWPTDLVGILALLAAVNLLTASGIDRTAISIVQLVSAIGAVLLVIRRGYSLPELGLARNRVGAGLRLGAVVVVAIICGVALLAALPATRSFFEDDRFIDQSLTETLVEAGVRIPLVTALCEELLFRSVLLSVLLVPLSPRRAAVGSAAIFGLWHVLTADDGTNLAVVVVATSAAGVGFAWLRLRSGSVAAPWLVHAGLNSAAYVAGAAVAATA